MSTDLRWPMCGRPTGFECVWCHDHGAPCYHDDEPEDRAER